MPSVRVFCGGSAMRGKRRSSDIVLDVAAPRSVLEHVTLQLNQITRRLLRRFPARLADLVEIATYVYCADQFTKRGSDLMPDMGVGWRRSFQFYVAVREPDFWNTTSIAEQLAATLGFLSDDSFRFEFTGDRTPTKGQGFLELSAEGGQDGFVPDEVMLFSGGLDSFAGALDALVGRGVNVALVSHRASTLVAGRQMELVRALRGRSREGRLLHVAVGVTKGRHRAVDFSQRTRSFLFAALGFAVAHLFDRTRVSFYENGVVSLNLPLAEHVLGSRATRTTHPRLLAELGVLFSRVVARDVRFDNPFFWKTKSDVVQSIAGHGCGDLIPTTFSCASVRDAQKHAGRHCGVCSQCLDRRFGVLAADCGRYEPANIYSVDLFRGAREPGVDAIMAEQYVMAAHRYAESTQVAFLGAHAEVLRAVRYLDMPSVEAASRLHALHIRHGQAVKAVLNREVGSADVITTRLGLPDSSLLAMVLSPQAQAIVQQDPVEAEPPATTQAVQRSIPLLVRPLTFGVSTSGDRVKFGAGPVLQGSYAKLIWALMPAFNKGAADRQGSKGYIFVSGERLAAQLGITEQAVRQRVRRLRDELAKQFLAQVGATIGDDEVVETRAWNGYRLNPHLSAAPMLVDRPGIPHAAE